MTARSWVRMLFNRTNPMPVRKTRLELQSLERREVPAVFTVTNPADDGSVNTLRWAVGQANSNSGADTINFNLGGPATITLGGSQLSLADTSGTTTIIGPAAGVTVSGDGVSRVFEVNVGVTATISGLSLINGKASQGAAVRNVGHLTLMNCTVSGNTTTSGGGGIFNYAVNSGTASIAMTNCTVVGNSTGGRGGGVFSAGISSGAVTLTMNNCTVTGNAAGIDGSGISFLASSGGTATTTLTNTLVAGNAGSNVGGLNAGISPSSSNNLIGVGGSGGLVNGVNGNQVGVGDAKLGTLGNYGGPTQTIPLLPGSPAIDKGGSTTLSLDQRGFPRSFNGTPDIGAYELNAANVVVDSAGLLTAANAAEVREKSPGGVLSAPLTPGLSVISAGFSIVVTAINPTQQGLEFVKILNSSDRDLEVNAVNTVDQGATPFIFPTRVEIRNLQPGGVAPSKITIDGAIENPIGTTVIDNQRGDIVAGADGAPELIRTHRLELNANTGSVGQASNRIETELVQSDGRILQMHVESQGDAFLAVTGVRRESAPAGTFIVVPAMVHAGGSANLLINDSAQETPSGFGGSAVKGSGRILLNSNYTFPDIAAGATINVQHPSNATTITASLTTDVDATLTDTGTPSTAPTFSALSTRDGVGRIDVETNGFVDITEVNFELFAGDIRSRNSFVEAEAPDKSGPDQDVVIAPTATISAATTVLIRAGDDVQFPAGAALSSGSTTTIRSDFNNVGTPGAIAEVLGKISATQALVHADNNDDVLIIERSQDATPCVVFAHGQRGVVNLRGNKGTIDFFSDVGPTTVNAGSKASAPVFAGSATFQASTRQIFGSFASSGITAGQTIRVYGTQNNNGTYVVQTASPAALTLTSTSVLVDEVAAAARVTNATGDLNAISGAVRVFGSPNQNDTLNVDDSGDALGATNGTLTSNLVSGEGLGSSGIQYTNQVELNVFLGTGNSSFTINGTNAPTRTAVDAGLAGSDTVTANFASSQAGRLTVTNAENTSLGVTQDLTGSFFARMSTVQSVVVGRDVTATGLLRTDGDVGAVQIGSTITSGKLAGQAFIGRDLSSATVYGDVSGLLNVGRDVTSSVSITSNLTNTGRLQVGGNLKAAAINGDHAGRLDSGSIGSYLIDGALSPTAQFNSVGNVEAITAAKALQGRVVIGGDLRSISTNGDWNGNLGVNGDLGELTGVSGLALSRGGQLFVGGNFNGQMAVSGNVFADTTIKGNMTGRWVVKGVIEPSIGNPNRRGILAAITVEGAFSPTAAIVSYGQLGDANCDNATSLLRASAIQGLLNSYENMYIGNVPNGASPPAIDFSRVYPNESSNGPYSELFGPIGMPPFFGGSATYGPTITGGAELVMVAPMSDVEGTDDVSHLTNGGPLYGPIYTNGGVLLFIDPTPLGQAYFNLILIDLASLTVIGAQPHAPKFISAECATLTVGQPGTFTPLAAFNGTVTTTSALPGGVSFVNGVLSGTPLAGTGGDYTITFVGSNGVGTDATQNFVLHVVEPPSISGRVFNDFNHDGVQNFGEAGIGGVSITLSGVDVSGTPVNLTAVTNTLGDYVFLGYAPSNAAGYALSETQPTGFADGKDTLGTLGGVPMGAAGNDQFTGIKVGSAGAAVGYNFGERPIASTAVGAGVSKPTAWWASSQGQSLILSLNGGGAATQLGNWLAATFPNMYASLAGNTNAQIASKFISFYNLTGATAPSGPASTDSQAMAVALAMYVTNSTLAGSAAVSHGFTVDAVGLAYRLFNVGSNNGAFGLAANGTASVIDLMLATNAASRNGLMYDADGNNSISTAEAAFRTQANTVYTLINGGQSGSGRSNLPTRI